MKRPLRLLCCLAALIPGAAAADANIIVDGVDSDWAGVTSCWSEPAGDGNRGIDLVRVCSENNNTAGDNGYLFQLFESQTAKPTNVDTYFGFYFDRNNDGVVDPSDEVWAYFYRRGGGSTPTALLVLEPGTYNVRRTYSSTSDCGGPPGANGWSGRSIQKISEGRIAYGCMGLTFGNDNRVFQLGAYPNFDVTPPAYYDGTTGTVTTPVTPGDVVNLTASSRVGGNTLFWTNPAQHEGVLVLRAPSPGPNTLPVKNTVYTVGQSLGNATVAYVDSGGSTVSSFADTGLTNGVRYYYKVYNHHQNYTFAVGNQPSTSGIFSEPTSRAAGSPLWCYSVGYPSMQQPSVQQGTAVITSGNLGAVTANITSTDPAIDGLERWRPVQLAGPVQARLTVVALSGLSGYQAVTGDQSGRVYAINLSSGTLAWTANGGAPLGDRVQAFVMPNGAKDRLYFGTRNNSTTSNKVYALNASNGSVVWTYSPGDLDIISGGTVIDSVASRLYVVSRGALGTDSYRVLDLASGARLAGLALGDIDYNLTRYSTGVRPLIPTPNSGAVSAIDPATHTAVWNLPVGPTSSPVYIAGSGFIASLKSGAVERYAMVGTTMTRLWTTPITNPSGIAVQVATQKIFVGSSDGKVHQLNADTGVDEKQVTVSAQAVGMPAIDSTSNRLHVGTLDGRLCAFQLPFP